MNINNQDFISIELILRTVQKDNEYSENINNKALRLLDAISHFFSINFHTANIENISKFIFYFSCYILNKKKLTPGEEYTQLRKNFNLNSNFVSKNKFSVLIYILTTSIKNLILKYIHSKIYNQIERKIITEETELKIPHGRDNFYSTLFNRFTMKIFQSIPNYEAILDKLEEIQFALLFIKGKYYDLIQRAFGFKYEQIDPGDPRNKPEDEIINREGFKFFGYLMSFKLSIECILYIRHLVRFYKEEKNKLLKENKEENKDSAITLEKEISIKLKKNKSISTAKPPISEETNNSCLLCLDTRKDTSSTSCGHLFCWGCIIKYLQTNNKCPYCRTECLPQNVIYLQNYK